MPLKTRILQYQSSWTFLHI